MNFFKTRLASKILLAFVLLWGTPATAQNTFNLRHLGIDDGLSQGTVTSILQDSLGVFWFATKDGLNKYNGYSFTVFRNDPQNPYSISQNFIQSIDLDRDGNLWALSNSSLDRFDPRSERFAKVELKLTAESRNSFLPLNYFQIDKSDPKGDVIYIGSGIGLLKYEINTKKTSIVYRLSHSNSRILKISTIYIDREANVWFGTDDANLGKYNPRTGKTEIFNLEPGSDAGAKSVAVTSILQIDEGSLLVSTNRQIYLKPKNEDSFRPLPHPNDFSPLLSAFYSIVQDREGEIYVAVAASGVYSLNLHTMQWQKLRAFKNEKIEEYLKFPYTLMLDRSDNIWVGLNGYGLIIFPKAQNRFNLVGGLRNDVDFRSIRSFYPINDSTVYIGGYNVFARFNPTTGIAENLPVVNLSKNEFNKNIYAILPNKVDGGKSFWLSTEGDGLYQYFPDQNRIRKITQRNNNKKINLVIYAFEILQDEDNLLWIATQNGLVVYNPETDLFDGFSDKSENEKILSNDQIASLMLDEKGYLWVGTEQNGLFRFNKKTGKIDKLNITIDKNQLITNGAIKSIFTDVNSQIWLGTSKGLVKFVEGGKSVLYTVKNGLPNEMVYGIVPDDSGFLWLSTNKGISKFNPKTESFKNFSVDDGLQSNEFNSGAFAKSPNGTIFFGGVSGFNFFKPNDIKILTTPPNVVVRSISLFSHTVLLTPGIENSVLDTSSIYKKHISLNYNQNDITFELAGIDVNSNGKILYSYKLEGYNEEFSQPSPNRLVTFTNLPSGEYTLLVKVANKDLIWSKETALMNITIATPFWKTWWFSLLLVFLTLFIIYSLYIYRVKAIQLRNEKLEAIIQLRTKELEAYKNELLERKEELETTNASLTEANNSKDRFFSMFAHDLKSPFSAILGYLDILTNDYDDLSEQDKRYFTGSIAQVAKNLFLFIENVLDLFRIELGRISFEPEYFSPAGKIASLLDLLRLNLEEKRLNTVNEIPDDLVIFADVHMFQTIVQNLVANAIKFSEEGGDIIISARINNNMAEFAVTDSGVGIPQEAADRLFDKSSVLTTEGTKQEKGTGLGLTICKDFTERNGGTIRMVSQPGVGSSFLFTLPLKEVNSKA